MILIAACGTDIKVKQDDSGKFKLAFKPEKDKPVRIKYQFTVNSEVSGNITFDMDLSGTGETAANGDVTLLLKNEEIEMTGTILGQKVSGSALNTDSLSADAKLVALPVFAYLNKTFKSAYDPQLNKKYEVQMIDTVVFDSTENKLQFLLRYPETDVLVGDSWDKEIMVKAGNKMNCTAKYTLLEVKGDTAIISISGKLFGKGESFGNEFSMDGNLVGTFKVDLKSGWPIDTDVQQQFVLKMGGKDIPMKYDIKCTVK